MGGGPGQITADLSLRDKPLRDRLCIAAESCTDTHPGLAALLREAAGATGATGTTAHVRERCARLCDEWERICGSAAAKARPAAVPRIDIAQPVRCRVQPLLRDGATLTLAAATCGLQAGAAFAAAP